MNRWQLALAALVGAVLGSPAPALAITSIDPDSIELFRQVQFPGYDDNSQTLNPAVYGVSQESTSFGLFDATDTVHPFPGNLSIVISMHQSSTIPTLPSGAAPWTINWIQGGGTGDPEVGGSSTMTITFDTTADTLMTWSESNQTGESGYFSLNGADVFAESGLLAGNMVLGAGETFTLTYVISSNSYDETFTDFALTFSDNSPPDDDDDPAAVPEPASLSVLALGAAALGVHRRSKRA